MSSCQQAGHSQMHRLLLSQDDFRKCGRENLQTLGYPGRISSRKNHIRRIGGKRHKSTFTVSPDSRQARTSRSTEKSLWGLFQRDAPTPFSPHLCHPREDVLHSHSQRADGVVGLLKQGIAWRDVKLTKTHASMILLALLCFLKFHGWKSSGRG